MGRAQGLHDLVHHRFGDILGEKRGSDRKYLDDDFRWPSISAYVRWDNEEMNVPFEANLWFEQATDEEIIALQAIDWGGNMESDEVARFMETHDEYVRDLMLQLDKYNHDNPHEDLMGFECYISGERAKMWLGVHRLHLLTEVDW